MFKNRREAGQILGELLAKEQLKNPLVLAIPRGGVVVAFEVANRLRCPLDVVLTKKIGAPWNREFAVAAVDIDGELTVPGEPYHIIDTGYLKREAVKLSANLKRSADTLRGGSPPVKLDGMQAILVDDGLATGLTVLAAGKYLRRHDVFSLLLAVPVAPSETIRNLSPHFDKIICPLVPTDFLAVGQWYEEFPQVDTAEVVELLHLARTRRG